MTMWYDCTPAQYANGLRFYADRSDESARHYATQGSSLDVARFGRQAARLRAMAILCDISKADRAGDVDFLGMSDPRRTAEQEAIAIREAYALRDAEACDAAISSRREFPSLEA